MSKNPLYDERLDLVRDGEDEMMDLILSHMNATDEEIVASSGYSREQLEDLGIIDKQK